MDEQYVLTTPENVPISYELAGVGSRFVAALIDFLIIFALQIGLFIVVGLAASFLQFQNTFTVIIIAMALLFSFVVFLGYPVLFEIIWSGQTPGKRKVRVRMVQNDGGPITATAVIIRNIVRLADFLPAYYIIGIVVMLIDSKGRRLGDLAGGTICVKERHDIAVSQLIKSIDTLGETDGAFGENNIDNLSQLTYEDYHLVQEYLMRRDQLTPDAAHNLAVQIANSVSAKLALDLGDESPEDFLVRIGSALRRRGKH